MRWTLSSLVGGAERRGDAEISGLAYDHRCVEPGDLFCCWSGRRSDGHDFAGEAKRRGAAALLVERFVPVDLPQARVEAVRPVLGPLADRFFEQPSRRVPVVAVTGTNGKTTVTFLLESIARAMGRRPGVIGTISRRWLGREEPSPRTTPEAIDLQRLLRRMVDDGVNFVAMEAASDGLAQGRLRGTHLVSAGFTNLTRDHLDTHGSMEAYFEAKASLFDGSYTRSGVINIGDPYGAELVRRVGFDVLTFGSADADIVFDASMSNLGLHGELMTPAGAVRIDAALVGRSNIECAAGLALHAGSGLREIAEGVRALRGVPGRFESVDAGQPFLALVDYAHTPDALAYAVRTCRELADGRLIVVFGCGGDRDREKRPLMGEAATKVADLTVITSDNPRSEDPGEIIREIEPGARSGGGAYEVIVDREAAIRSAVAAARAGDVVLVAGKGHEQGQQFADRTIAFDDREVLRRALQETACRS
jgi:UDP-N-acetylmuramoyl-L-alanyl-D-glutamate--2,6-diaminopimelate ligase